MASRRKRWVGAASWFMPGAGLASWKPILECLVWITCGEMGQGEEGGVFRGCPPPRRARSRPRPVMWGNAVHRALPSAACGCGIGAGTAAADAVRNTANCSRHAALGPAPRNMTWISASSAPNFPATKRASTSTCTAGMWRSTGSCGKRASRRMTTRSMICLGIRRKRMMEMR